MVGLLLLKKPKQPLLPQAFKIIEYRFYWLAQEASVKVCRLCLHQLRSAYLYYYWLLEALPTKRLQPVTLSLGAAYKFMVFGIDLDGFAARYVLGYLNN